MDYKNGHWYTDKNGNHYFVENGQSPKEGWEASKRRKMIDGGEYKVDDGDGSEPRTVSRDEYDKYEADSADFDMNQEDDFGFDEEEDEPDGEEYSFEDEVSEILERLKNESDMYYDARSFAEQKLRDYSPKAREEALRRFRELSKKPRKEPFGDREIPYTAGEIEDEQNEEENDTDLYSQPAYGDEEGHDYELDALREREERGLDNDQGFEDEGDDIKVGDEYDFRDGGFVIVEDVKGDQIRTRSAGGETNWVSKEDFNEMIRGGKKVEGGTNPFANVEPDADWGSQSDIEKYRSKYEMGDLWDDKDYNEVMGKLVDKYGKDQKAIIEEAKKYNLDINTGDTDTWYVEHGMDDEEEEEPDNNGQKSVKSPVIGSNGAPSKEWFEETFEEELSDEDYREIVETFRKVHGKKKVV